jgi:small multidrug resistance pump
MWWALAGAILIEVVATLSLRASDGFRRKAWIAPVVAGYLASFYLLWLSLSLAMPVSIAAGIPVGVAYGIWGASGTAATAVVATAIFGDLFTWPVVAGIGLIIAGVLVVRFRSRPARTDEL